MVYDMESSFPSILVHDEWRRIPFNIDTLTALRYTQDPDTAR